MVHLNNAGAALPTRQVLDSVVAHLELEARVGGYEAAMAHADALAAPRLGLATLLDVDADDLSIVQSDTAAWSKAFWGLAMTGWFDGGGRVIVDRAAYNSHYLSLLQARDRFGISIEAIDNLEDGSLSLADLDRRLDPSVRMVTATHVGTHRGLVNPVAAVGERTRALGVPYFLDACQSTGQLRVDLSAIGCDVATGTGRKFLRGPRGTGWLFVRPEWSERMSPPGIDAAGASWDGTERYTLAPRARRFDEFEFSYAARIGMGVAIGQTLALGIDAIEQRITGLAERLRAGLSGAGITTHDGGTRRSAIVTFSVPGRAADEVRTTLAAARINFSVVAPPFARLDMESRGLEHVVRASPHVYNTDEELDRLVQHAAK
ncbi:aminotransferase class V-fold PLP-dependent enzyme [soil metagenome]